jgi:hypothetical protein
MNCPYTADGLPLPGEGEHETDVFCITRYRATVGGV